MDYDVAVIGGGPAGYVAAIKAAQLGGRAVLFEKDTVGGTCLNRGCIPTKTYVKAAEYLHHIENAKTFGITVDASSVSVDMPRLVAFKDTVVKKLTSGVASLLKSNGVDVVREEAKLESENAVLSGDKRWAAKNVILCGGSVAGKIPVPGIEHPKVFTSDGMLAIKEIPRRLAVIGGGVADAVLLSVGRLSDLTFDTGGKAASRYRLSRNRVIRLFCGDIFAFSPLPLRF